jgi:hypothetical protein
MPMHHDLNYYEFQAAWDCYVADTPILKGDHLSIIKGSNDMYQLYLLGESEPIATLNAHDVNKLAGEDIVL